MKLDYGTRISYSPIGLPFGLIRKPTLEECTTYPMSFEKFNSYESMLLLTPDLFFTEIAKEDIKETWLSLAEEERDKMTLYDLITLYSELAKEYEEIFDFFFIEKVIYENGIFFVVDPNKDITKSQVVEKDIHGFIGRKEFDITLSVLRQICCIGKEEVSVEEMKFKNEFQKNLYLKYLKDKEEEEKKQKKTKQDNKMLLSNIISAVANKHNSLNYTNIWKLTVFQLFDTFERLQANAYYDIGATRTSVWGDEKKVFESSLWYKNHYEDNKSV